MVCVKIGSGILLVFIYENRASMLEGSNAVIWKLVNGERSIQEIIAKVSERYSDPRRTITRNVLKTVNGLQKINAIHLKK